MMTRINLVMVLTALAVLLIACGGSGKKSETPGSGQSTASAVSTTSPNPNGLGGGTATPGVLSGQLFETPGAATRVPTVDPSLRPNSTIAVDANPATQDVDNQVSAAVGADFKVAIVLESAGAGYAGYQFDLGWDPAVVSYVSVDHLKPANLSTCSPTRLFEGDRVAAFCADQQLAAITYTGQLSIVTLHCQAAGNSVLHLRAPSEGAPGTKVEGMGAANEHVLTRIDATVSCR